MATILTPGKRNCGPPRGSSPNGRLRSAGLAICSFVPLAVHDVEMMVATPDSACELGNLLERVVLIEGEWSFLACCVGSVIARMEFSGSQTTLPEGYLQCSCEGTPSWARSLLRRGPAWLLWDACRSTS